MQSTLLHLRAKSHCFCNDIAESVVYSTAYILQRQYCIFLVSPLKIETIRKLIGMLDAAITYFPMVHQFHEERNIDPIFLAINIAVLLI